MTRFFDDFWLASELDAYNLPEFGQRITAFHGDDKPLRLDYPAAPVSLGLGRVIGRLLKQIIWRR